MKYTTELHLYRDDITVRLGPASPARHGSNLFAGGSSRNMPGASVFILRLIIYYNSSVSVSSAETLPSFGHLAS
jgi:hypothetical protein